MNLAKIAVWEKDCIDPGFCGDGCTRKAGVCGGEFRTDPESLEEELLLEKEALEKFWEAKIVLATIKEKPYFRVLTPPYFSKEKREGWPIPVSNWKPLEKDPDLGCDAKTLKNSKNC